MIVWVDGMPCIVLDDYDRFTAIQIRHEKYWHEEVLRELEIYWTMKQSKKL